MVMHAVNPTSHTFHPSSVQLGLLQGKSDERVQPVSKLGTTLLWLAPALLPRRMLAWEGMQVRICGY